MDSKGRIAGQAPGSPYQWPTDGTFFRDRFQKTKSNPSTLTSINNLAAMLRDQGKPDLAEEMY
jgi:hypothetical protein